MLFRLASRLLPIFGLLVAGASSAIAEQRLADFRRVVIDDQAGAVEKAAADELAHFAGRIVDAKIAIVPWSKYRREDGGLSFFVGTPAAEKVLEQKLGPWKDEEWLLRTIPQG